MFCNPVSDQDHWALILWDRTIQNIHNVQADYMFPLSRPTISQRTRSKLTEMLMLLLLITNIEHACPYIPFAAHLDIATSLEKLEKGLI